MSSHAFENRFRVAMCENALQLGGIRTGTLDYPNPHGGQSCRVAHFNTGGGLRTVIALDRGADLVEASFNETNFAFLTSNDYKPPSPAYNRESEWLVGWPGGLLTTCGPGLMGEPRREGGHEISLHGRFSNTPAAVTETTNPVLSAGETEMRLAAVIRDTRMFGASLEVRRTWRASLGQPWIELEDVVVNRGDETAPHGMLYHINLGYPLVDEGARLIYRGAASGHCLYAGLSSSELDGVKNVPGPDERFHGANEGLVIIDSAADREGWVHTGIVNRQRGIGLEIAFPAELLPRLANWQHFGPRGSYVTALEPFNGSIFGTAQDSHPQADQRLEPGESRRYLVRMMVCRTAAEISELERHDGPLVSSDAR